MPVWYVVLSPVNPIERLLPVLPRDQDEPLCCPRSVELLRVVVRLHDVFGPDEEIDEADAPLSVEELVEVYIDSVPPVVPASLPSPPYDEPSELVPDCAGV